MRHEPFWTSTGRVALGGGSSKRRGQRASLLYFARLIRLLSLGAIVLLSVACAADEPLPACAELSCPDEPSGTDDAWTPCADEVCFCRIDDTTTLECTP